MALKSTPEKSKRKPGRPENPEKSVDITLKVTPAQARYLTVLGERHGFGQGHTEVARFLLRREMARLEELEATNERFSRGQTGE
jgi:hypothetical protein